MKTKILALFLLAGSSMFAGTHFGIGISVGGGYYPPAPIVAYSPPPAPVYVPRYYARPGYAWVNGYWYPSGPRYVWHAGYYAQPPYVGAYWVGPRYYGHRYYPGYWRR
jgi:WXXGXW repeat (2 copies)